MTRGDFEVGNQSVMLSKKRNDRVKNSTFPECFARLEWLHRAIFIESALFNHQGKIMNENIQVFGAPQAGMSTTNQRNQVLRNTYWLLALSMVPTVLGAWVGIETGIARAMSPGIGLVVFLVGAFGFMFAIEKTKNSAAGVPVLLGFTFFMGLMLARLVGTVLGLANGAGLVMTAFAGTGAIFFGMATLSSVIKRDLSSMGKWLFIGVIMLLVAGIANFFIQSSALMITLSVLAIGMFSAFILHDLKRVKDGIETNYITATLGVYLSLYNVFSSVLALLGIGGGKEE
jgi:modulator of FtsH protease